MAAQQMMNASDKLVQEAVDGVLSHSAHLARLDGYPDIKCIVDREMVAKKSTVAIISGGGSGHEPGYAGFVGHGMLAGAVAGEVFASPSAEAVLAAIRTLTGPKGCLIILMNYTGDRLHFGLAAEQAKAEGLKVEMVCVGEDVAIDSPGLAGRRGLAGTALVLKVAGATAAAGGTLAEVAAAAQAMADNIATLGVALRVCTLPGKAASDRLKDGEIEIGLGIHGEPGIEKTQGMSARDLTQRMLNKIASSSFFKLQEGERVVLLVNNLGASMALEMGCVTQAALTALQHTHKVVVERCLVGPFVTSLDMAGMSLTLMRVPPGAEGDAILAKLDYPVNAAGWPNTNAKVVPIAILPVPKGSSSSLDVATHRPASVSAEGLGLEAAIRAASDALIRDQEALNALDAKVGDGDCGDTVSHGANAILAELGTTYPLNDVAGTVAALARSVRQAVGGTSGALYDVALTAAAASLRESLPGGAGGAGPAAWAGALRAGASAVSKYGGARAGSRTMLDALLPAVAALEQAAAQGLNGVEAAEAAAAAAAAGAEATKEMAANAGRASYVPAEVLRSVPDPGAMAVAAWMAAVASSVKASA
eukprot:CAMPEP_0119101896 /NCGR_PEP_ID=MMETSP1180-20130426/807_1 /TAXON_ID=3052 ORGANISM="Chlamydomonas cf sp, Strain CCMP681" /NCGR_SAMPLE_ID=MMETSP1180 /ASSEMBLY_ACC=CAM_ASM_000741 /LENGTH=591 /DNA_ID=CAMNT_0007086077 /DNA_START=161 /DNA_END=1936 /DNA_ORIENTATION=+